MLRAGQSVLVVGAGVVGITSAYMLARAGLQVTVLERNPRAAAETSFANGGQLSYAYGESIASPASLKQLMGWLWRPDSPVILTHAPRNAAFADWAWRYLRAAMPHASRNHTANLLRLGMHSCRQMQMLVQDLAFEFDYRSGGILYLYRSKAAYRQGRAKLATARQFGFTEKTLSVEEAVEIEPCLKDGAADLAGVVHSPDDATGDPYLFTHAMAQRCLVEGVKFHYDAAPTRLLVERGQVTGASDAVQAWRADAVVLAAGSFAPGLLRDTALTLPVQPMKGYSVTFDAAQAAPVSSLSDVSRRLVHTRLGNRVRIAGFAEFAGADGAVRPEPIAQLKRQAQALVPGYAFENLTEWACLRAATPDGLPVIGETALPGLWLNTGHGMLGWTQAAGSAELLTCQMMGQKLAIPMKGYAHARF